MEATAYIALTFKFQKEGRRWIGVCKETGTSTYSRSLPEVEKQLQEAVCLHLNTLEELGERERFFKENKIKVHTAKPKNDTINIPTSVSENAYYRPYIQDIALLSMC
jgi:predicted RNase H-like HicB family nuclease